MPWTLKNLGCVDSNVLEWWKVERNSSVSFKTIKEQNREMLTNRLVGDVAVRLQRAIAKRGRATLALSGGATPGPFMTQLGKVDLDWKNIIVTLSDERWVPANHPRSNHRLVNETLFSGRAKAATFVPLYQEGMDRHHAVVPLSERLTRDVLPLDVCVLGMGEDLHTASLFPGVEGLARALDPSCPTPLMTLMPATINEPRMTMTASALLNAHQIHLLIAGERKEVALIKACKTSDILTAPIKAILDGPAPVTVWYAP